MASFYNKFLFLPPVFYTDPTLNGLAQDCYLESTEIDFNSDGDEPLAFATLNFLTNYINKATTPDVAQ